MRQGLHGMTVSGMQYVWFVSALAGAGGGKDLRIHSARH